MFKKYDLNVGILYCYNVEQSATKRISSFNTLAYTMATFVQTTIFEKKKAYVPPHMRLDTQPNPTSKAIVTKPVTTPLSFKTNGIGMILCAKVNGGIRYGLVKRKCGYSMHNILQCSFYSKSCFEEISDEERRKLLHVCNMENNWEKVFEDLWTVTMYDVPSHHCPLARLRFMQNKDYIKEMLENTTPIFPEGVWGFPKGKPDAHESDVVCAFREVQEETQLLADNITILPISKQYEVFKRWAYTYFVASVNVTVHDKSFPESVGNDTSELRWCSLKEALHLIPDVMDNRKKILQHVHHILHR